MPFGGVLPVMPPVAPMLAKSTGRVPTESGWLHEPKWDGFRALVFRDGDHLEIQSRSEKPLLRYFPELREPLLQALPDKVVVDGEIVLPRQGALDFGALQMRLHPAASRIDKLAASWLERPLKERRSRLEAVVESQPAVVLTPFTDDPDVAVDGFQRFEGAGLDGVVSKAMKAPYTPGKRTMRKIKRNRTVDCVLCGFRWHKSGLVVGSLILGLYDPQGRLHHLGVATSFSSERRRQFIEDLEPLRDGAEQAHPWRESAGEAVRQAGSTSRWSRDRDVSWEPVRLERVVEVECNQITDGRLRHPARFVRWRPDREPTSCMLDQIRERPAPEIGQLFDLV